MKKFKLVDGKSTTSQFPSERRSINWNLCVLCQEVEQEPLTCPNNSERADKGAGYKSLDGSLIQFSELGEMFSSILLSDLDEGIGIEANLTARDAKWHKSCRNGFNNTMLERAIKITGKSDSICCDKNNNDVPSQEYETSNTETFECQVGHFTRSFAVDVSSSDFTPSCFICDRTGGTLHEVTTFEADTRVRKCAHILKDLSLLAKLSAGD
jgi:hypothetical protein